MYETYCRVFLQSYSSSLYCEILSSTRCFSSPVSGNRAVIVVTAGRSDGAGNDI